jgi:hypothetical protein
VDKYARPEYLETNNREFANLFEFVYFCTTSIADEEYTDFTRFDLFGSPKMLPPTNEAFQRLGLGVDISNEELFAKVNNSWNLRTNLRGIVLYHLVSGGRRAPGEGPGYLDLLFFSFEIAQCFLYRTCYGYVFGQNALAFEVSWTHIKYIWLLKVLGEALHPGQV